MMKKIKRTLLILILVVFCGGGIFGSFYGKDIWQELKYIGIEINNYLKIFPEIELPVKNEISQSQPHADSEQKQVQPPEYVPQTSQEEAVIRVVREVSPAVVSIIITKDLPVYEEYYENPFEEFFGEGIPFEFKVPKYRQKGTEKQEIGGGTGFIISADGMILTNKHVVSDTQADYTVLTNDGKKYPAKVLARDPFQDLAILKIEKEKLIDKEGEFLQKPFTVVHLGDSENLQIGQTVIAIGNALGEFRNTVSVGVISGLGRTITASGGGIVETLEDVIQTDAAINRGNSGGPLLNLKGEVIGVNVAMAQAAQNIGFAIPINKAKKDIEQVKTIGKIVYPFLGVRYVLITKELQKERNLKVDYGALIVGGETPQEPAIVPGSQAEKAGLREGDIILEVDGEKITLQNSLAKIIRAYNPGDKLVLKILRGDKEITIEATLGEKTS
ncbi:trypsin-like peptidase domain-containing protein [bacterium]|nr:trypsin-like peptidase domain-containing protein [bacterium]